MTRAKVGYDFTPTPRKWHAAWAGSTMAMRGLRSSLFELNDGAPIAVEGDWLTCLCKLMNVGGRERPNVRKALLDLQARGVLAVDDQTVSICFRPDSQLHRPVVDLSAIGRGSNIPIDSTPQNDSTHVSQTDRQTDKKEETEIACGRAPARETVDHALDLKPPVQTSPAAKRAADKLHAITLRWYSPTSGKHVEALEELGSRPEAEWVRAAEVIEREMTKPSVAGMMTPAHLLANWGKYANGEAPIGRAELQRRQAHEAKPAMPQRYAYRNVAGGA